MSLEEHLLERFNLTDDCLRAVFLCVNHPKDIFSLCRVCHQFRGAALHRLSLVPLTAEVRLQAYCWNLYLSHGNNRVRVVEPSAIRHNQALVQNVRKICFDDFCFDYPIRGERLLSVRATLQQFTAATDLQLPYLLSRCSDEEEIAEVIMYTCEPLYGQIHSLSLYANGPYHLAKLEPNHHGTIQLLCHALCSMPNLVDVSISEANPYDFANFAEQLSKSSGDSARLFCAITELQFTTADINIDVSQLIAYPNTQKLYIPLQRSADTAPAVFTIDLRPLQQLTVLQSLTLDFLYLTDLPSPNFLIPNKLSVAELELMFSSATKGFGVVADFMKSCERLKILKLVQWENTQYNMDDARCCAFPVFLEAFQKQRRLKRFEFHDSFISSRDKSSNAYEHTYSHLLQLVSHVPESLVFSQLQQHTYDGMAEVEEIEKWSSVIKAARMPTLSITLYLQGNPEFVLAQLVASMEQSVVKRLLVKVQLDNYDVKWVSEIKGTRRETEEVFFIELTYWFYRSASEYDDCEPETQYLDYDVDNEESIINL